MCNQDFLDLVQRTAPSMICIDGPCQTNGPQVLPDWSDWDREANDGKRRCELLLHQAGVHLFWTTNNTVFCFDGASRWIARSLRLYRDLPANHKAVETHPHGAFAFLWRQLGGNGRLPNKKTDKGRDSRLALLKAFVENVDEDQLHNHDAVDAACAALMAAFHEVGWVESYGDDTEGGRIWMPRIPM
jgi:predicted nuclease with RNAse H fold